MDPYRHVEVVRVEECASCEARAKAWRAVGKVAQERLAPLAVVAFIAAGWLGFLFPLALADKDSPAAVALVFAAVATFGFAVAALAGEFRKWFSE